MRMTEDITEDRFKNDIATHQVKIVIDQGQHRHLVCRRPETYAYHFHIATWPGYLAISGDMGSFTFSRLPDMFKFFRGKDINTGYWAATLKSSRRPTGHRKFSPELYVEAMKEHFGQWTFDDEAQKARAWAEIENDWGDGLLPADPNDGNYAIRQAMDYECPETGQRFKDFWDHNFEDYTYQFVWCCRAIRWAIEQYDRLQSAANDNTAQLAEAA